MSARMDVHGEDETTARKTCTKMFNDPLYKHVFEEGDAWKIGEALHKWEYAHSPEHACMHGIGGVGEKRVV